MKIRVTHPIQKLQIFLHQMIQLKKITILLKKWRPLPYKRNLESVIVYLKKHTKNNILHINQAFSKKNLSLKLYYSITFFSEKNELFRQILCQIEKRESYFLYGWYPSLKPFADVIRGQLLGGERFTYRLELEVPSDQTALSVGRLIRVEKRPNHRKLYVYRSSSVKEVAIFFISNQFIRYNYPSLGSKRIHFFLDKHYSLGYIKKLGSTILRVEQFYRKLWGAPSTQVLKKKPIWKVISFGGSGARGYPFSLLLEKNAHYLRSSIKLGEDRLFTKRQILLHELAHTWWGNAVTGVGIGSTWLNEGLANYSSLRAIRKLYGLKAEKRAIRRHLKDYLRTTGTTGLLKASGLSQMVQRTAYSKGTLVFYILERIIGRKILDKGLKLFFNRYKGHFATIKDLQKTLEQASQHNLKRFFKDWIEGNQLPLFQLKNWHCLSTKASSICSLKITINNLGNIDGYAHIRAINNKNQSKEQWIHLRKKEKKTLIIPLSFRPTQVLFDPDKITIHGLRWKAMLVSANFLRRSGKLEQAKKKFLQLLSFMPKHGQALYNMGLLMEALHQFSSALQYYQKAIQMKNATHTPVWVHSWALFRIANLYKKQGKRKIARIKFHKLLNHSLNYYGLHQRIRQKLKN